MLKKLILLICFAFVLTSCQKDYSGLEGKWYVSNYILGQDSIDIGSKIFSLELDSSTNIYKYNGPENFVSEGQYSIDKNFIEMSTSKSSEVRKFYIQEYKPNILVLEMNRDGRKQIMFFNKSGE